MKQALASFVVGVLFALGLGISGMTQPENVIGFLDIENWNPSLLFVMAGAVGVHAVLYRFVKRRKSPLLDTTWHVPTKTAITPHLVFGSAIFGVGWGLAGYCPGPAMTTLASFQTQPVVFVGSMLAGMITFKLLKKYLPQEEDLKWSGLATRLRF